MPELTGKVNYIVVTRGHIAFFEQYEAAWTFAADFGGRVLNVWGLRPLT